MDINPRFSTIKEFLDEMVDTYNRPAFIEKDPISIPHRFSELQDIEISGFFAAVLAWGQRKTILNKCNELMERMDNRPYDFILYHQESDLGALLGFKHRTFNDTDLLYFVRFLQKHYQQFASLEDAFLVEGEFSMQRALIQFKDNFEASPDFPLRTGKHIGTPAKHSACKRLNMFLRWMVRDDDREVDFGLWKRISSANLICPYDVHVQRVAKELKLVTRKQSDWLAAQELTENLRGFDPCDPVKYDFALFGLGVEGVL